MATITVSTTPDREGWIAQVEVKEGSSQTRHTVSLRKAIYEELTAGREIDPATVVRRSFEFLLERESKESILRRFDLTVISQYFPEYESVIKNTL